MKIKEINQHNNFSILVIISLLLSDVFSYVICKIIGNFLGSDGFEFFWVFPLNHVVNYTYYHVFYNDSAA